LEAHSCNYSYSGKAINIEYCVCVCVSVCVALVIQHAKCMHPIILSSVGCPALPYYSTLSHKWHYLWKELLNIKYVISYYLQFCLKHFSIYTELSEISQIYIWLHIMRPLFLSDFNHTRKISIYFLKILKYKISWKSNHADGRWTERHDEVKSRVYPFYKRA
jgi:hypothetical protein